MSLVLLEASNVSVATLAEAKYQCKVDDPIHDDAILRYVRTAERHVEIAYDRALLSQKWALLLDAFPSADRILIPKMPVREVTLVTYRTSDEVESILPSSTYILNLAARPPEVVLRYSQAWPGATLSPAAAVRVEFTAGVANTDQIDDHLKNAVLMLTAHYFRHPEAVVFGNDSAVDTKEVAMGVRSLLASERLWA